jgi:hypothetical protein
VLEFSLQNWEWWSYQKLLNFVAFLEFVWLNAGDVRDVPRCEMYPVLVIVCDRFLLLGSLNALYIYYIVQYFVWGT